MPASNFLMLTLLATADSSRSVPSFGHSHQHPLSFPHPTQTPSKPTHTLSSYLFFIPMCCTCGLICIRTGADVSLQYTILTCMRRLASESLGNCHISSISRCVLFNYSCSTAMLYKSTSSSCSCSRRYSVDVHTSTAAILSLLSK